MSKHGLLAGYSGGCRCEPCREAFRAYKRARTVKARPEMLRRRWERYEQAFWSKVEKTDGCWLWQGGVGPTGYGRTHWQTGQLPVHRLAWLLSGQPDPGELELDHLCRVRNCVNPEHLELVTHQENMRRAMALRTHCPQGHPYDEENTKTIPSRPGWRYCRACHRESNRRYNQRKRERAA